MKKLFLLTIIFLCLCSHPALSQHFNWAYSLGEPAKSFLTSLAADSSGNVYTLGYHQTDPEYILGERTTGDIFLTKRDSSGHELWTKNFRGAACGFDIAIDRNGRIIMGGSFKDSLILGKDTLRSRSFAGLFLAALDASGNLIWHIEDTSHNNSGVFSITTDKNNNIYLTGLENDLDGFFAKFTSGGTMLWKKKATGVRIFDDIVIDDTGNIYVGGCCDPQSIFDKITLPLLPSQPGYIIFLAKFDSSATAMWVQQDPYVTFNIANELALTDWGIVRYRYNFEAFAKMNLEVFSTEGELLASRDINGSLGSLGSVLMNTLAVDRSGGIYIAEQQSDTLNVKNIHIFITPDTLVLTLDTIRTVHSPTVAASALVTYQQDIYLCGSFDDKQLQFDEHIVKNQNNISQFESDLFLTQITPTPVTASVVTVKDKNNLTLYPNPCNDVLNIGGHFDSPQVTFQIQNILGEILNDDKLNSAASISLKGFTSGAYLLIVHDGNHIITKRFIRN